MDKIDEIEDLMKKFDVPYIVAIDEGDEGASFSVHGTGKEFLVLITALIRECVPKEHQKDFMDIVTTALGKLQKED